MKIYLAARYSRIQELNNAAVHLRDLGHEITSRWIQGNHQISDPGLSAAEHEAARMRFAREDLEDVIARGLHHQLHRGAAHSNARRPSYGIRRRAGDETTPRGHRTARARVSLLVAGSRFPQYLRVFSVFSTGSEDNRHLVKNCSRRTASGASMTSSRASKRWSHGIVSVCAALGCPLLRVRYSNPVMAFVQSDRLTSEGFGPGVVVAFSRQDKPTGLRRPGDVRM